VLLRPGNVHSAQGWQEVLEPIVARYKGAGVRLYFRADAAFASPGIYEYLEEHGLLYAMRLPSNHVLEAEADAAQGRRGMIPAECAAQACQDRGQAGEACPAPGLSDG
jgi:hypothetical protein